MASPGAIFDIKVSGLAELANNLRNFASPRILGQVVKAALQAGGRVVRGAAAGNARGLGLGFVGYRREPGRGLVKRYGRIPRAMKVGRAYIPRGNDGSVYRVNVVARGQRVRGIVRNAAPHAHLFEYGFNHVGGTRVAGRPFAGPALNRSAGAVVEKIRENMAARINRLQFPTTGKP